MQIEEIKSYVWVCGTCDESSEGFDTKMLAQMSAAKHEDEEHGE